MIFSFDSQELREETKQLFFLGWPKMTFLLLFEHWTKIKKSGIYLCFEGQKDSARPLGKKKKKHPHKPNKETKEFFFPSIVDSVSGKQLWKL